MTDLDQELERRGLAFVRYADDCNIYVGSKVAVGRSLAQTIESLNPLLRGWINYFRLTQSRRPLEELDAWVRRHLRLVSLVDTHLALQRVT